MSKKKNKVASKPKGGKSCYMQRYICPRCGSKQIKHDYDRWFDCLKCRRNKTPCSGWKEVELMDCLRSPEAWGLVEMKYGKGWKKKAHN